MNMNERLECIEQGMKDINESITPFRPSEDVSLSDASERAVMLRKHAALLAEWDAVQQETEELQQELKEDKWITVFRTVTEQADGMMSSLEKAVNRCQVCEEMYFCRCVLILYRTSYGKCTRDTTTTRRAYRLPALFARRNLRLAWMCSTACLDPSWRRRRKSTFHPLVLIPRLIVVSGITSLQPRKSSRSWTTASRTGSPRTAKRYGGMPKQRSGGACSRNG